MYSYNLSFEYQYDFQVSQFERDEQKICGRTSKARSCSPAGYITIVAVMLLETYQGGRPFEKPSLINQGTGFRGTAQCDASHGSNTTHICRVSSRHLKLKPSNRVGFRRTAHLRPRLPLFRIQEHRKS